jgi:drug/metabolite transporter (DMT)-like permease
MMTQVLTAAANQAHTNRAGIAWMVLAMTAFIANDATIKVISARLPAAQMVVVRGVMAISLILLIAWRSGALGRLRDATRGWVLVRASCEGAGTFLYLAGLFNLPLGNVTAINLASPLFIAVLAMLVLRERVTPGRWLVIAVGFTGVLLVVQPRADGFNHYAWMSLLATMIYAVRDLLTRKIPSGLPAILVTLSTATVVCLIAVVVLGFQGWTSMAWSDLGLLAIASVFLSTGYYSIIMAMRDAELSVVAPFRYVGLLEALALGYLVWGDIPNVAAWIGIALLIGTGLFMIRQQTKRLRVMALPARSTVDSR